MAHCLVTPYHNTINKAGDKNLGFHQQILGNTIRDDRIGSVVVVELDSQAFLLVLFFYLENILFYHT